MPTKIESLKNMIRMIKRLGTVKGITITEAEMAAKINMPVNKFYAHLEGKKTIPGTLTHQLYVAYGDLIKQVEMEQRAKSNRIIIDLIIDRAAKEGITITADEMAQKINIPKAEWQTYLTGETYMPVELREALHLAYKGVLKNIKLITHTVRIEHKVGDKRFNRRIE